MIDKNVKYLATHEWAKLEDGVVIVGLSDVAYKELGDIVFLELPEEGREIKKEESFGVIESVKAASDMYAPVSGKIVEVNKEMEEAVDDLASDAYNNWLIKIAPADAGEYDSLWDADKYEEVSE